MKKFGIVGIFLFIPLMLFCSDGKKVQIAPVRDYSDGYHKSTDFSDREKLERNISDILNSQNVSVLGNNYAMVFNQTNPGKDLKISGQNALQFLNY